MSFELKLVTDYSSYFHLFVIVASFLIMVKSADLAVYGVSDYAKKLGISDYLIGLIVVSMGASMPELVSSITGSIAGNGGIIFGTIIGSNMAGLTLVLGALSLVGRKLKINGHILEDTKFDVFLLCALPFVLMIDSKLSRIDGIILVSAYFIHIFMLWKKEGELGRVKKDIKLKTVYRDIFIFLGCLVALLLSGRYLVFSSINLANKMGISPYYIALVIIGIGSSAPDITVGIKAVIQRHQDVGFGNILGSMAIKSLLFLGTLSIIKPIYFDFRLLVVAMIFTLFTVGLVLLFLEEKEIDWRKGIILVFIYIFFIATEWFLG